MTQDELVFLDAAKNNALNVLKALVDKVDINVKDKDRNTPLIWASFRGNSDAVKFLLDNGADMEARDYKGDTALDLAKFNRNQTIINMFDNEKQKREENRAKFAYPILITGTDLYDGGKLSLLGQELAKDTEKLKQFFVGATVPYPFKRKFFLDARSFINPADKQKIMAVLLKASLCEKQKQAEDAERQAQNFAALHAGEGRER